MRELMLASQPAAVFPMEVRSVAADEAYLSSNYGTPTTVISVSGIPGTDYWPYLRAVDRLLGEFGARVQRSESWPRFVKSLGLMAFRCSIEK